ncbi:MAG: DUF3047 domain-containing protein [Methylococcales bacterium]
MFRNSWVVLILLSYFFSHSAVAENIVLGRFSAASLENWQGKSFKGKTDYQLVNLNQKYVLKADSNDSASGLFYEQQIDLQKKPVLHWRWRVENRLPVTNEQEKSGDDYAARVYVIVSGGLAFWQTRAINYVWASRSAKGKIWPNAYAGEHAMMLALRSADDQLGTWYEEKRNVFDDMKTLLAENVRYIDAIAIMTDTDNSHGKVTAYYGDIYFSSE